MAAGFCGVHQYLGWLIFMYKVTSKIKFDVLLKEGGTFMKNLAVTFSVLKFIYECPLKFRLNKWFLSTYVWLETLNSFRF